MEHKFNMLGKVTPRKDGIARVTGRERYTVDISLPRMLHGRILSSPYAHARVKNVDVSDAEAMGAVCLDAAAVTGPPLGHPPQQLTTKRSAVLR